MAGGGGRGGSGAERAGRVVRAVGYVRVSTEREDMVSPALQVTAIKEHCTRHGYTLTGVVEDLDLTGRKWAGRQAESLVKQAEAGTLDVIVVWKGSRWARNRRDWAVSLDRLDVAGARLEAATEDVDVTSSTGRFTRGMLAEIAAWESERIGDQWREAQARRLSLGLPHGGGRRFGYAYDGTHTPDGTAPVLAEMYRRYIAGQGFARLTMWLNGEGHRTVRGNLWSVSTVIGQMDSGFAAGLLWQKRTGLYLPGAHPPVIGADVWEAYLAQRRRQSKVPVKVRSPRYVLTGLLKCGECGASMSSYERVSRGRRAVYYRCTAWQGRRGCRGTYVSREHAEQVVMQWLDTQVRPQDVEKVVQLAQPRPRLSDADRLRRDLAKVEATLDRQTVLVAEGVIPVESYQRTRDRLTAERDELLERLTAEADRLPALPPNLLRRMVGRWDLLPVPERHRMLSLMVERVTVDRPGPGRKPQVTVISRV